MKKNKLILTLLILFTTTSLPLFSAPILANSSRWNNLISKFQPNRIVYASSLQIEELLQYGVEQNSHLYAVTQKLAIALAKIHSTVYLMGSKMRDASKFYDLGGQDGKMVFGSEELVFIALGKSLRNAEKAEIYFRLSKPLSGWVKDVPEPYTLSMSEEFGFADVHDNILEGTFGFRGGFSIFTLPFVYFELLPENKMVMKLAFLPKSIVDVHPIKALF